MIGETCLSSGMGAHPLCLVLMLMCPWYKRAVINSACLKDVRKGPNLQPPVSRSTFVSKSTKSSHAQNTQILVMGRTPFHRTSIELEHHFSNIERTRTCSFVGDRAQTP